MEAFKALQADMAKLKVELKRMPEDRGILKNAIRTYTPNLAAVADIE